jgi:hypothetical protein
MHTFLDSKAMAKALRTALAERQIDITHSDSLELVARQFGFDDWNTLAARIEAGRPRKLPQGWHIHHGAGYPLFEAGADPNDPGSVTIVSISSPDVVGQKFATLMQSISAEDYRGETLRLTADLRGEDVGYGALWMRVDPKGGGKSLRFDNMLLREKDGALSGRFGWTERSIVLEVPDEAGTIHYGPMLKGSGQLWARNLRLDTVPATTATTDTRNFPRRPTGFGDGAPA